MPLSLIFCLFLGCQHDSNTDSDAASSEHTEQPLSFERHNRWFPMRLLRNMSCEPLYVASSHQLYVCHRTDAHGTIPTFLWLTVSTSATLFGAAEMHTPRFYPLTRPYVYMSLGCADRSWSSFLMALDISGIRILEEFTVDYVGCAGPYRTTIRWIPTDSIMFDETIAWDDPGTHMSADTSGAMRKLWSDVVESGAR